MTLRPEYSLGHSPYNAFLFAAVGNARPGSDRASDGVTGGVSGGVSEDESKGEEVTVLSALTRLQVDPWAEAARLAGMPTDAASAALAATLMPLTGLVWVAGDAGETARRLVALLPAGRAADIPLVGEAPERADAARAEERHADPVEVDRDLGRRRRKPSLLGWALLLLAMLAVAYYLKPSNEFEMQPPPGVQR